MKIFLLIVWLLLPGAQPERLEVLAMPDAASCVAGVKDALGKADTYAASNNFGREWHFIAECAMSNVSDA